MGPTMIVTDVVVEICLWFAASIKEVGRVAMVGLRASIQGSG